MSAAWALCRDIRRRAGLSQREFAQRARVSPSTIARIEKGRMEPTLELLDRLARGAGLELHLRVGEVFQDDRALVEGVSFEDRLRSLKSLSLIRSGSR